MRSRTNVDLAGRCRRCYLMSAQCLCAEIPTVPTRTRVLVVRHALEAVKTTNTGRFAALALPQARVLEYGGLQPFDVAPLAEPDTWLLFPTGEPSEPPATPPRQLVVLDGTWTQARRIAQRVQALWHLPRLSIAPPTQPLPNLRQSPFPGALSTLESIALALELIEGPEVSAPLRRLQERIVESVLDTRGRRPGQA